MDKKMKQRLCFLAAFILLISVEVIIALFVHDDFVRPYLGDVIVTVVVYCFVRIFIPQRFKLMPLYVLLFATAIEVGQYFDFVNLIGLGDSRFFCTILGTSFSWLDIICYAVGCLACVPIEIIMYKRNTQNHSFE